MYLKTPITFSFIFAVMYLIFRRLLFLFDPESVHYFAMNALKGLVSVSFFRSIVSKIFRPGEGFTREAFGLTFSNFTGLGAGFDKNAKYLTELETLGFGFVEIGTVTPKPQDGNPRPRLFRLPADHALVNRMGFNNDGVHVICGRLQQWRSGRDDKKLIIGGNIGKNKTTPNEDAWKDYEICFRELFPYVDYFVVNVSSPNTPGLRELQEKDALKKILSHLQTINQRQAKTKPILLKIAPDLTDSQLDDVIELAMEIKLDGLVATNTTISRAGLKTPATQINNIGAGGLSGAPVRQRATEVVEYITKRSHGSIPVIASGGIFNGSHAQEKFLAGATLIQVWTGFIYEGPSIVKKICNHFKV